MALPAPPPGEHGFVFVSAYDGASRAGEVCSSSGGTSHLHHFQIAGIDLINLRTQVKVGVHQLIQSAKSRCNRQARPSAAYPAQVSMAPTISGSPRSQRSLRLVWKTSVPSLSEVL